MNPSLQTAGSGLSKFSAAANQSSVENTMEEPRVAQLRVFSSVHSGSRVSLVIRGHNEVIRRSLEEVIMRSGSIYSNCENQNTESYIYLVAGLEAIACVLFLLVFLLHVIQISETFHEFLRLLKCVKMKIKQRQMVDRRLDRFLDIPV